jgi:hypothetical protein
LGRPRGVSSSSARDSAREFRSPGLFPSRPVRGLAKLSSFGTSRPAAAPGEEVRRAGAPAVGGSFCPTPGQALILDIHPGTGGFFGRPGAQGRDPIPSLPGLKVKAVWRGRDEASRPREPSCPKTVPGAPEALPGSGDLMRTDIPPGRKVPEVTGPRPPCVSCFQKSGVFGKNGRSHFPTVLWWCEIRFTCEMNFTSGQSFTWPTAIKKTEAANRPRRQ